MTVLATIAFAAFLLEDDHLVALHEGLSDFANYFGSFNGRSAYLNGTVGIYEKHAVELYCVALLYLAAEMMNIQEAVLFGFELLALNFYDNVHYNIVIIKVRPSGGNHLRLRLIEPGAEKLRCKGKNFISSGKAYLTLFIPLRVF